MFRRIVVPIDFSPCSDLALEHALALRDLVKGNVEVLHVWASPEFTPVDAGLTVTTTEGDKVTLTEYVHRQAQKAVSETMHALQEKGIFGVTSRLVMGDPASAIVSASADCDLIVMGTHGRRALAHLFLGSVAERVVRLAKCPVLTVRAPK